jgi:hypothetical protein
MAYDQSRVVTSRNHSQRPTEQEKEDFLGTGDNVPQHPHTEHAPLQEVPLDRSVEIPRASSAISIGSSIDSNIYEIEKPVIFKPRHPVASTPIKSRAKAKPIQPTIIDLCGDDGDDDIVLRPPDDYDHAIGSLDDDDSVLGDLDNGDSVLGGPDDDDSVLGGPDAKCPPEVVDSSSLPQMVEDDDVDETASKMPEPATAEPTRPKTGRPRKIPRVPGHIGRPRKNWLK